MTMRLRDMAHTATAGLRRSTMRSLLTVLGIVIGIASVIILMSVGKSVERLIVREVEGIGSNLVFIAPGSTRGSRLSSPPSVQGVVIKTLVEADRLALEREPALQNAAAEVRGQARIIFENNDTLVTFTGVTANFFEVRNFSVVRGRLFTESDIGSFNRVTVLGSEISKTLFGERDAVGKTVRLKDATFRVIGVLGPKGIGPFGVDQDTVVLVPITIAQHQLLGIDYVNVITAEANPAFAMEFVEQRIASVLRKQHRITDPEKDDFTIRTQADALALLGNITAILTAFLTSIASIALLVGGIGVMNIMLVSVVERTREIGLRKALGATERDILAQFLWEAIMLTSVGGLLGIIIGSSMVALAAIILSYVLPTGWVFALPPSAILLAFGVSGVTGLVFGIYPARQAARKNPIDALRYE